MQIATLSQFLVTLMMALCITLRTETANAESLETILTNEIPVLAMESNKQLAMSVKAAAKVGVAIFRDENVTIELDYQPSKAVGKKSSANSMREIQTIKVVVTNKTQTKILKLDTHQVGWTNEFTGEIYAHPRIDSIEDNYGNSFSVSIDPIISPSVEGIYPGQRRELKINFIGKLIPSTESLSLHVPNNVFGNDQAFTISLPMKPGVTAKIETNDYARYIHTRDENGKPIPVPPNKYASYWNKS